MKRTFYKPPKGDKGPLSGGIRVGENGTFDYTPGCYVTRVPGRLIWGLHNFPQWIHKVGEGYRFNLVGIVGEWHDFIPDYAVPAGRSYIEREGDGRPADDLTKLNIANGVFCLKIWDKDEKLGYNELIGVPKDE